MILSGCAKVPPLRGDLCVAHVYESKTEILCPEERFEATDEQIHDYILMSVEDFHAEFMVRMDCAQWKEGVELRDAREMAEKLQSILRLED